MSEVDHFFVYPTESVVGTFSYDENLPPLPLQSLDKTLSNYYNSLLPLATADELKEAKHIIQEFENGIGKKLHIMLQKRASQKKNWVRNM